MEAINVHISGVDPNTVHIHVTVPPTEILERLHTLEMLMTDMNSAVNALVEQGAAMAARIDEDIAHLVENNQALSDLLDTANANDADDAAAIASVTAERDALLADSTATVARINDVTSSLASIDPLTDFPAVTPPPPDETPAETPTQT